MTLPLLPTQDPRGNAARAPHHRPRAFASGLLSVSVPATSIAFAGPAAAQGNDAACLAIITRTIVPVLAQPAFTPQRDREFGLGVVSS